MESRIYNTIELQRVDQLGLDQLRVSVPIARRWSEAILSDEALDHERRPRAVLTLNERIFDRCCDDRCFRAVYDRYGIDPFRLFFWTLAYLKGFRTSDTPRWSGALKASALRRRFVRDRVRASACYAEGGGFESPSAAFPEIPLQSGISSFWD
jgi:hypothetical protein